MAYIRELSSIRGIAAVVVVFGHVLSVVDRHSLGHEGTDGGRAWVAPLFDFMSSTFNGPAAVELFFVLSGLVLSLSLARGDKDYVMWMNSFYIRRIFRIYPALWLSFILALALLPFERDACLTGVCTNWAATNFQEDFTLKRIALSFMGLYVHLNGPTWSLRVELFYSLLLPAIFLMLRNKKTRLAGSLFVLALAVLPIPRLYSVHYALAFVLGSAIPLLPPGKRASPYGLLAAVSLAVLMYSRRAMISLHFDEKTFEIIEIFASFVIVYAFFYRKVHVRFLAGNGFFYVGEISYSIYLLHFPLLFALLYLLENSVGVPRISESPYLYTMVLGAMTISLTIGLASLSFHFVELPFQSLGRLVSERIRSVQKV
ncbi:MAG: acyltransferase [Pseudomonadota bacterium]|nr:acyltransferase [Pseudomonadota bacterium]